MAQSSCGCGRGPKPVTLTLPAEGPPKPLSTEITWRDVIGGWKVRWGFGRDGYRVAPGLYTIGSPDSASPVLVTANYKLTVDAVRRELAGLNVWLLVLDTKGVNVWCAAGKGTFGTEELVRRIQSVNLRGIVKHRELVVPQLGATGVAAHEVKKATGFSVHYGPVRARDIRAYLEAGMKATPEMRRVRFGWKERLVVAPVDFMDAVGPLFAGLAFLAGLEFLRHRTLTPYDLAGMLPLIAAVLAGGFAVPLLLPWLPFRAFALKGAVAGALVAAGSILLLPLAPVEAAGIALLVLAITSYMAMTFTGTTTFTTLAGVRLEVRHALPLILVAAGAGAILRITGVFI